MEVLKKIASFAACIGAATVMVGCEESGSSGSEAGAEGGSADTVGAPAGFSVASTVFKDDGGVGGWPITTTMRSVSVGGGMITMNYDDVDWPRSGDVNGNCWYVYESGGQWYASTFDFLKPNQETKEAQPGASNRGIGSGDRVGVFVSTLARDSRRNGDERSQIYWITWP